MLDLLLYVALGLVRATYRVDIREEHTRVGLLVLLLHSRTDRIPDPRWFEYAAKRFPDSRTVWLENSGHFPLLEAM